MRWTESGQEELPLLYCETLSVSAFNQHVMFAAVQHGFNTANYTLLNLKMETNAIELSIVIILLLSMLYII